MRTLIRAFAAASLVLVVAGMFLAAPASAHERRNVGPYVFVVGFETEPAYVEQPNGASLTIARSSDGAPVEGAEKTLRVEVTTGGASKMMELKRVFGKPGAYRAQFIPTKTGSYQFRFFGDVEGQQVNEKFESGPGRFDDVIGVTDLQFPASVPTVGELAARGGQGVEQAAATPADVQKALDKADSARQTGMVVGGLGLLAGLAGLGVGLYALSRRPSGPRSQSGSEPI